MNINNYFEKQLQHFHGDHFQNPAVSNFHHKHGEHSTARANQFRTADRPPFSNFKQGFNQSKIGQFINKNFDWMHGGKGTPRGQPANPEWCNTPANQGNKLDPHFPCSTEQQNTLEASVDKNGQTTVSTQDGYKITCTGENQEWYITDQAGNSTRIWGDPHVVESDGDKWDFQEQSSFIFGNNKVTVETTPTSGDSDVTYTSKINIYNGNERIEISGIDTDTPTITASKSDAYIHDILTPDGQRYYLSKEANGDDAWIS